MGSMTLTAAFFFGLMGGAHCIGMCGGIMSTLSLARSQDNALIANLLAYNSGRIFTYTLTGGLVAFFGTLLTDQLLTVGVILRIFASAMLILMALYLANWWKGLVYVESLGRYIWRVLQPIASKLMPVRTTGQALLLGLVWGWLPCGLIYSVLIWTLSAQSPLEGALIMLFFGLGTLPAMLLTGSLASQFKQLSQSPVLRSIAALLIIAFALWQLAPLFSGDLVHAGH
jgi:sulfite exporter TauE/SafE